MDVDPLSDTVPPRYAIESDEEEDEFNPLQVKAPSEEESNVEIKIIGDIPSQKNLVVASGDAGKLWAKGADLGEQIGAVSANGVQMGLIFNPSWTKSTVIVSEVLSKLPLDAMNPYAGMIIQSLKPQSVALLDTYPLPTYSTSVPISFYDAPPRYLSTSDETTFLDKTAKQFSPPNLIQSTSASFLSILALTSVVGTLILLPSPHIPSAAPRKIAPSNFAQLAQDDVEWPTELVSNAQSLVFQSVGENCKNMKL